jgi:hypothetical protein
MIREGKLLPRNEISDYIGFVILETKNRFLQLNRTLPSKLIGKDPRELADVIKSEVRQILTNCDWAIHKGLR